MLKINRTNQKNEIFLINFLDAKKAVYKSPVFFQYACCSCIIGNNKNARFICLDTFNTFNTENSIF